MSARKNWRIRQWAARNKAKLCFTPTNASWANPIEAHFGPPRQFTLANSHHRNHTVQTRQLHRYLRWRNQNPPPRRPDRTAPRTRPHPQREGHSLGGGRPLAAAA
ncbi:hypothetical protein [Streptomyces sp. NPDC054845]